MNLKTKSYISIRLIICLSFILYSVNTWCQNSDTELINELKNELKLLKEIRQKDSLKMLILSQEITKIISEKENPIQKVDSLFIKQKAEIENIRATTNGLPVVFFNDTLFNFYSSIGPYDAKTRVVKLQENLQKLYMLADYSSDSIFIKDTFGFLNIFYKNEIITAVTKNDAIWEQTTTDKLANKHAEIIKSTIEKYRSENSLKNNLIRLVELAIILLTTLFIIWIINKLFKFIITKLSFHNSKLINGLKIKNYEILNREHIIRVISKVITIIKYILILIVLAIVIPLVFNLFPTTQTWAETIKEFVWNPIKTIINSILLYLPKLLKIVIIVFIVRYVLRLLKFYSLEIENEHLKIKGFYPEWAKTTYSLVRFVLLIFSLVIIFPLLPGSDSDAFKGISVFLGVLISIGSSSAIANAIAGLVITYMRPFKPGDWIKTGEITGIVINKSALVTRLKTINNEDVSVPNSAILSGATINYTSIGKTDGLVITAKIKVRYSYSQNLIEELLLEAANSTNDVAKKPYPYVFQLALEDFYAIYEINAFTFVPDNMYFIKSDLIKNIQKVFKDAKIEIQSSHLIEIKTQPTKL